MRPTLAAALAASLLAPVRGGAVGDWTIRFEGRNVEDAKVGLFILAPEGGAEPRELAVSSSRFGYFALLPYASDRVLSGDARNALEGTSSAGMVTLQPCGRARDGCTASTSPAPSEERSPAPRAGASSTMSRAASGRTAR